MPVTGSSRFLVLATLLLLPAVVPAGAQVRVGPLGGYSFLQHTDTSLSHGPLDDAATVGRTWLVGGVLDARLTERDVVSVEFVYGPYHNDVDRYCIDDFSTGVCEPFVGRQASHATIVDLQYARIYGRSAWRPYVGGGFGFKRYSFESDWRDPTISAAVLMTVGVRSTGRRPVRLEATALLVTRHPILNDKTQFEVQARVVALMF